MIHGPNLSPEFLSAVSVESCVPVDGGHMLYGKYMVTTSEGDELFVKVSDPAILTDDTQAARMMEYLIKEQMVYELLGRYGFEHVPDTALYGTTLAIEALKPEDDWFWEAPPASSREYTEDVLGVLGKLSLIPIAAELAEFEQERAMTTLLHDGWVMLAPKSNRKLVKRHAQFAPQIHEHVQAGLRAMVEVLQPKYMEAQANNLQAYANQTHETIAHLDARQPNVGWHPNKSAMLVDMSWVDGAPPLADTTMFLIDLHKSNRPIEPYLDEYFDPRHARLLVGYWLGRCVLPTKTGDLTVRFHQYASAVSAVDLLLRRGQLFAGE